MKDTFEEIFILCLGEPEKLKQYIDTDMSLAFLIREKYSSYIQLARAFLPGYPLLIEEAKNLNHSKILDILHRRRPDLYDVIINHQHGLSWLKNQNFEEFWKVFNGE